MSDFGKYGYVARGYQRAVLLRTPIINVDNGNGTTLDHLLFANLPTDAYVLNVQFVYTEATDTAGAASANFKLGTAVGGAQVVAATAYEVSKAVGSTTTTTIVDGFVAAGGACFVRHTGIAATEAGQGYVQAVVLLKP